MSTRTNPAPIDTNLKFKIAPLGPTVVREKHSNRVNLQITRNLLDPSLQVDDKEIFQTRRKYDFGERTRKTHSYSEGYSGRRGQSQYQDQFQGDRWEYGVQQAGYEKKRYAPKPVPLNNEWLKTLPEHCPKRYPQCEKHVPQVCQDDSIFDVTGMDGTFAPPDISPSMKPLFLYDDDSSSFVKDLLSSGDDLDHRSYIRSLIPHVDDDSAASQKDSFFKSLIVNPGDMPDWQRSSYVSDGDSSYALQYLEQTSPTSEQSIPMEESSESHVAEPKEKEEIFLPCEQGMRQNTQLYKKHPPLIKKQYYSRFPGPRNPLRCTLRIPYKPCLPQRKANLRCLLMNEYAECEKALCNIGLGFISTQP